MTDETELPPSADEGHPSDRRRNHALRELVDEMLASIRVAASRDLWTPEERSQYERELAGIMARVRGEAVPRPATGSAGSAGASGAG